MEKQQPITQLMSRIYQKYTEFEGFINNESDSQ